MIYLASPYSHPEGAVREQRFRDACYATARWLGQGLTVFSPIVQGHPLVGHGLPTQRPFWDRFDWEHLRRCHELVILTLVGWFNWAVMAADLAMAGKRGLPMFLLSRRQSRTPRSTHVATEHAS